MTTYVPFVPAVNDPACVIVIRRSADATTRVGSSAVLFPEVVSVVPLETVADVVTVPSRVCDAATRTVKDVVAPLASEPDTVQVTVCDAAEQVAPVAET